MPKKLASVALDLRARHVRKVSNNKGLMSDKWITYNNSAI